MRYIELNNEVLQKKNGFFQLEKDQEAIVEFEKEVAEKLQPFASEEERIHYLIDNNYYEDFLAKYALLDILTLTEKIFAYNFKFQSFMAISKFYKDYALKTNNKQFYLERYEHRIIATALHLGQGDIELATHCPINTKANVSRIIDFINSDSELAKKCTTREISFDAIGLEFKIIPESAIKGAFKIGYQLEDPFKVQLNGRAFN